MIASRDRAIYECLGLMEHLENQIGEVENRQKALARDAEVLLREQDQVLRKLEERRKAWKPKAPRYPSGVLSLFSRHAVSPMKGGYME